MFKKITQFHKQGVSKKRIVQYLAWLVWAVLAQTGAYAGSAPDAGGDMGSAVPVIQCTGLSYCTASSADSLKVTQDDNFDTAGHAIFCALPNNNSPASSYHVRCYSFAVSSGGQRSSIPPTVQCAGAAGLGADTYSSRIWLNDGDSCSLTVTPPANGDPYASMTYNGTLSRTGNYYYVKNGCFCSSSFPCNQPEIELVGNDNTISNGDTTPSTTDDTDFGSTLPNTTVNKTFTIRNVSQSDLALTGSPKVDLGGCAMFSVTSQPSSPITACSDSSFTVQYNPNVEGTHNCTVSIANDDSDENPYTFAITGVGVTPEINLVGNSNNIADGDNTPSTTDNTDFGETSIGSTVNKTFTIENSGDAALNLSGSPIVALTGADCSMFSVTTQPTSSIASSASANFTIRYNPTAVATHNCTVSIANDDSDENPYDFAIKGVTENISPVAGFGFALDFDGIDDYIEVSDMPYVQISSGTNATFELWLKTTNPDSLLFSKNLDYHFTSNVEFELGIVDSKLRFNSQLSTGSVNDGKLHHVAVVLNGLSGSYYIDGELDSTFTVSANTEKAISLLIGARRKEDSSDIGDFYAGELDDIRIWNTARTQTQIQDNMYTSLLGDEAGLIAYWALDENTGTTITDSTGNTTDGTFNSAPAWIDAEALVWETSLNIPISDTLPAYDSDGDTITYSLVDNDSGAAVITNTSTGAFTYTPTSSGTRTFSYKVNDGFVDSNVEIVTMNISSLIVDNLTDIDDGNYATGQNTLREAIANAKAGDTITFAPSIAGQTINLDAVLTIDKNLNIDGSGQSIVLDGQNTVQIFNIKAGTITLKQLTMQNGSTTSNGGGIDIDAGTTVTILDSNFVNNTAVGYGGAIMSDGNVTIERSLFDSNSLNTTALGGGAIYVNSGQLIVRNATFYNNTLSGSDTKRGGAINVAAAAEIYNSTFVNNTGSLGGAIYDNATGVVVLKNSLFKNNIPNDCETSPAPTANTYTNNIAQNGCNSISTDDPLLGSLQDNGGITKTIALQIGSPAINAGDPATCEAIDQRGVSRTAHDVCDIGAYELELIPSIPGNLTASASDSSVALSWTDSLYETNYILSRDGGASTTLIADTTSYTDSVVNCDANYSYSLYASNGSGDSDSVSVVAQMPACPQIDEPTPPNAPINFVATAISDTQIELTWLDDSSIESGYHIERDNNRIARLDENTETYLDENLKCETQYNYELYAYNSIGESSHSIANVTTLTCPPPELGNLSATVTADNITLTWQDVDGETSYLVTRDALTTRKLRVEEKTELPADSISFIDANFECGQSYTYTVAAIVDSNTLASASINVDAVICITAPIAPSQLTPVSINDNSVTLSWLDNSDNETGFYIYQNGQLVNNIAENSQSIIIQNLECETAYTFQVIAYNGDKASSETISATTDICPVVNLIAPSHFVANNLTNNQIQLTWVDNSLNETGFPIARNGVFITIASSNTTSFIDTNLKCGTKYTYQIYATDSVINVGGLTQTINTPACPNADNFNVHLSTIGSGIINYCNATICNLNLASNSTLDLFTTPSAGWQFSHWSGDCSSAQLLVNAEKNCIAHFTQIIPELTPEITPVVTNPLDPTTPSGAVAVPQMGASLCGNSFTNHNATTGNLNICETGSVAGGNLIGDNINEGLVSSFTLNENATITGGRLSGFNTNYGTLQDLTITQYSEVTGGFYAGLIDNNGTMIDSYIHEDTTIFSSTGQGSITGITQNKGTIQGTLKLGVNTFIIGGQIAGKIIAPAKSKAYLGDVEILPGATLENVYLSPTVKLPRGVKLINVTQAFNPAEPDLEDFGINMNQLDDLDARTIVAIEPAAIALFDRYEIADIPADAFAGMTPEQTAAFRPETAESITIGQFTQLSPEALAGFTAENVTALSLDVMQSLTPEKLDAFNPKALQQAPQITKLLTNIQPDTPQEIINKILPEGWKVSENGKIIPAVGSKLNFKGVLNRLPNNVLTPYLIDFQSNFSIGGAIGNSTVGGGFNIGLQQTPSIDTVDLDQFIFTQNEYGIFNIVGTGDYEGIVFAFIPNANNIEQAPLDTPVGLTTIEGGYFEMITPDKQKFILINAPNNPVGLQQALGGESTIKLSPTGDVLMRVDTTNRRRVRFETNVMIVGCFDAFVEPASNRGCADVELCDFGMEFPLDFANLRAKQQAKVIYPDGTAQVIYPTVIYPETLVSLLQQYDVISKALYKSDGTFEVVVNGQKYNLLPDINIKVRRLDAGEKRNPKINLQNNVLFYQIQEGDDLLTFSLNIELN